MLEFNEYITASPERLKEEAKRLWEIAAKQNFTEVKNVMLQEAQFYLSEIDRRAVEAERLESTRIGRRDFRMEIGVMGLIGLELVVAIWGIVVGVRESREQTRVQAQQIESLRQVEKAIRQAGQLNLVGR